MGEGAAQLVSKPAQERHSAEAKKMEQHWHWRARLPASRRVAQIRFGSYIWQTKPNETKRNETATIRRLRQAELGAPQRSQAPLGDDFILVCLETELKCNAMQHERRESAGRPLSSP